MHQPQMCDTSLPTFLNDWLPTQVHQHRHRGAVYIGIHEPHLQPQSGGHRNGDVRYDVGVHMLPRRGGSIGPAAYRRLLIFLRPPSPMQLR
jgi:hypothetical protein